MTLLSTPPFAPNTLHALQSLGIQQLADLQKLGAVHTFLLLKAAGHTFTRSILWQLHAACLQTDVRQLTATDKAALLTALQAHPPVTIFPPMANMMAFMQHALAQAQQAAALDEIPVGAVVVYQNQIIAAAELKILEGLVGKAQQLAAFVQAQIQLQEAFCDFLNRKLIQYSALARVLYFFIVRSLPLRVIEHAL